ncbi:Ribulose bisphosphate carboxylase/oxygenase activase, chloroplastic, partial [Dichanthelium oligosanthes]
IRPAHQAHQRAPITQSHTRTPRRGAAQPQLATAMATTSLASSSPHPRLFRCRRTPSSAFRTSSPGRLSPIRCSPAPSSPQPATGGEAEGSEPRRLSKQSSWEAKDADGDDYLYRLGKEADNMNIAVGARAGIVDDLFVGNFLGKDSDIVFDYRQKATRTFEYLQGDYYIAPLFLVSLFFVNVENKLFFNLFTIRLDCLLFAACHIVKNFIAHILNIKIPLILGIWGGKGQGKTFQTELIFRAMGVEPVIMSAGELESEKAGEPGRLIRDRYRTASQVIQNQVRRCLQLLDRRYGHFIRGKLSCLMINDLDAGVGRFGRQPDREDIINIVHGMYTKDGIAIEEVSRIVDTFPNQALDFYGALRSRTYDQAILEWVEQIGGHEKLGEKLLNQKKGGKLPTFIPPKQTIEALIESGHSLVREQELIMNSKLSKEYMKNLED